MYNEYNDSYSYGGYNCRRSSQTSGTISTPLSYKNLKLPPFWDNFDPYNYEAWEQEVESLFYSNVMWQVSKVMEQHNHGLYPSMSKFMLTHGSLNSNRNRKLERHDTAGQRPGKSVSILEVQTGGPDKLGCLLRDCKNYIQKVRRLNIGARVVDCINRMFIRMHQKNSYFFHLIRVDDEGRNKNLARINLAKRWRF
ncbi:hypothetical protein M9H77_03608 [Catharanthus roseus]|uniref:Uncharacterized protein n=1 Tax=Catharanthus roseus TaxID=4058 RepID=A0ACC0CBW5_CATRO|nr:hypothetical protein M9H77_03608 [Catharanthus roseus]